MIMTQDWDDKIKTACFIAAAGAGFMATAGSVLYDYMINRNPRYLFGPLKKHNKTVRVGEFIRMELSEETVSQLL